MKCVVCLGENKIVEADVVVYGFSLCWTHANEFRVEGHEKEKALAKQMIKRNWDGGIA